MQLAVIAFVMTNSVYVTVAVSIVLFLSQCFGLARKSNHGEKAQNKSWCVSWFCGDNVK